MILEGRESKLYTHDLQPIMKAVRQAASLCTEVQTNYLSRKEKTGREPVTIADYGSQAIICRAISLAFPDDAIIAEEHANQFIQVVPEHQREQIVALVSAILGETVTESDMQRWLDHGQGRSATRTWVIDPIDGTKGFLAKRRYSIAVGILEDKQPLSGVMGCPGYDGGRLFYVSEGKTFYEPLDGGNPQPVQVSTKTAAIRIVESVESAHADHDQMADVYQRAGFGTPASVRIDGQDKYAVVAAGDADLYLRISPDPSYRHKIWDHAAGVAIVQAAGGKVTDGKGKPLDFSQGRLLPETEAILVTNGHIHERVLEALS